MMQTPGRGVIVPPIVNRYTRLVGLDHPIVQEGLGPAGNGPLVDNQML